MSSEAYIFEELLTMMSRLRDPKTGCPWDLEQTFESIAPFTLEETHEVIDAIENGTPKDVQIELGDLLLQILFYCQIADENKWFNFAMVGQSLKEKLIRRHPHIFSTVKIETAHEQHVLWEMLKKQEREEKHETKVLASIPKNLPGLLRAQKLQARAASVGFDWPNIRLVLDKLKEEIKEFEEAYEHKVIEHAKEELGDILFVCANLARHMNSDAEAIMRQANSKFERRFNAVENHVEESGQSWDSFSLTELEDFWLKVKNIEKK